MAQLSDLQEKSVLTKSKAKKAGHPERSRRAARHSAGKEKLKQIIQFGYYE